MTLTRATGGRALAALVLLVVVLQPYLGLSAASQRQVVLIAIYALVVSGLNLTLGHAGELALGQAAVFAAGAYSAGYLGVKGHTDLLLALGVGAVVAALAGVVSGVPGLRFGSWSLAMVSLFMVLLVPQFVGLLPASLGGSTGLTGIPQPTLLGHPLTPAGFYIAAVLVCAGWLLLQHRYLASRQGDALRVLRQSPVLARSLGLSVPRLKLTAYLLGGIPAGLAGALYAYLQQFLSPSAFGYEIAVAFLAASVIGGATSAFGAVFGAAVLQLGPGSSTAFQKYSLVVYGVLMLLGGLFLSGGVGPLWERVRGRLPLPAALRARPAAGPVVMATHTGPAEVPSLAGQRLEVRGLVKTFGGLAALDEVSLVAQPGEVTAIIGPNGSGKTTLLNIVSGFVRATRGQVLLDGRPTGRLSAHRVARVGVARTFQTPIVPTSLSTRDVVASSRIARTPTGVLASALRSRGYRRVAGEDRLLADQALALVGLPGTGDLHAADLPLGTRRILEVARAVAGRPSLLLLDEPASGLDEREVAELGRLVRGLRDAGCTVVLVEHNFPFVLGIADRIHVLAGGRLLASGTAEQIRDDPDVAASYLGRAPSRPPVPVAGGARSLASEVTR